MKLLCGRLALHEHREQAAETEHLGGTIQTQHGCFYKLRVLVVGVFRIRALLFGVDLGAQAFWTLPNLANEQVLAYVQMQM